MAHELQLGPLPRAGPRAASGGAASGELRGRARCGRCGAARAMANVRAEPHLQRGFPHFRFDASDAVGIGVRPTPRKLLKRAVMQERRLIAQLNEGIVALGHVLAEHPGVQPQARTHHEEAMQVTIQAKHAHEGALTAMLQALMCFFLFPRLGHPSDCSCFTSVF